MELGHVEPEASAGDQGDRFPVHGQVRFVQRSAQRRQGAPQGRARVLVVVVRPEQRGQRLAGLTATADGQIGQKGDRLAGVNGHRRGVAFDARRAQETNDELSHRVHLWMVAWDHTAKTEKAQRTAAS